MTAAESYPFCKHHLFFKNKGGPACLYLFQMTVVLHTRHLGAPVPRVPGGTVALSRVAVPPSGTCWRLLSLSRYFSCILLHLCTGCAGGQANQLFCLRLTRASRWLCRAAVRCVTDPSSSFCVTSLHPEGSTLATEDRWFFKGILSLLTLSFSFPFHFSYWFVLFFHYSSLFFCYFI